VGLVSVRAVTTSRGVLSIRLSLSRIGHITADPFLLR
jgi:hypothetical protein